MKRTKILVVCKDIDEQQYECIEWIGVLAEHLGNKAKCNMYDRRIETPFAIIDFVDFENHNVFGYQVVLNANKDDERILRIAIGEETI